ncbi:MAG: hypothetical protein ABID64_02810 [Nitrospirota bacterium]
MKTPRDNKLDDYPSDRAETPIVSSFSGQAAQTDPEYRPNIKTPLIIGLEIDAIMSEGMSEDPATPRTANEIIEINEIIEELLLLSNLSQQQIYDSLLEEMDKTNSDDAQLLWDTGIEYTNEIIKQAFASLKDNLREKGERVREQQLLSNLQFCWQKVLSKEGKLLIIKEMRALIKGTDDNDLKKRLFEGFVLSIINSISQDNEVPCIEISDIMLKNLNKAKATRDDSPKPFPKKISLEILLPSDKTYMEIHGLLSSKKSSTAGNEHIIAEVMLEILEQDFFTDEQWEKIIQNGDQKEYIRICNKLYKEARNQVLERANGEMVMPSSEILTAYARAWNEIIYPRLLVWGEILYSDLLLPN